MVVRSDITVDWSKSPRIVTVAAPSTEVILQDLHDTLRDLEDEPENLIYDSIISSAGKEALGGGVSVGITSTLLNAKVAFEARTDHSIEGFATAINTGILLTDALADFVAAGVSPGDTVFNIDDQSLATISAITTTQLQHFQLNDGYFNNWEVSEKYKVYPVIQCEISGGNLVALDSAGADMSPVHPTSFTQVIRTSSSSATTQSQLQLEHSVFNGVVTVDITSGSEGTTYPIGTQQQPVNNMADALTIAISRGFDTFSIIGNITLDSGLNYSSKIFIGSSKTKTTITISSSANVLNAEFENATITGTLDGGSKLDTCNVSTLNYVDGFIENCILSDTITLTGAGTAHFLNCFSGVPGSTTPTINMGGFGSELAIRNYNGGIKITNHSGTDNVSIDMGSGQVIVDSTVISGTILIRGVTKITDNSTGTAIVDSSDAVVPSRLTNMQFILESFRPHHTGYGTVYYWDPENGDNTFDGLAPPRARKTLQSIIDGLVTDNNHDIIVCLPSVDGYNTIADETVIIDKAYTFIRGPGRDFIMRPSRDPETSTIEILAEGVEISSMRVDGYTTSVVPSDVIHCEGNFALLQNLWVTSGSESGIEFHGSENSIIDSCTILENAECGISLHSGGTNATIKNCVISGNLSHGICLESDIVDQEHSTVITSDNIIHGNDGYGININQDVIEASIGAEISMWNNSFGNIFDAGTNTGYSGALSRELTADSVWEEPKTDHQTEGSFGHMGIDSTNIIKILEFQRGSHTGANGVFYWDPFSGNDDYNGLTPTTGKSTWGGVRGLNSVIGANLHNVIIILPNDPSGTTVITEQIMIDKEYTFLRGPGPDLVFRPTATTDSTIEVSAEGVELSGMSVETATTGDGDAISISGDFAKITNVFVDYAQADGIRIQNASFAKLDRVRVRNTGQNGAGDGIKFNGTNQDCKFNFASNILAIDNANNGISLTGVNCQHNYLWGGDKGTTIVKNSGYGVLEQNNADLNHILGPVVHIHDNVLGNVNLVGTDSISENITQWSTHSAGDVWEESLVSHQTAGTFGSVGINSENIIRLLEFQRGAHTGANGIFYWDAYGGSDVNNGLTPTTAKLTWGGASGIDSLLSAHIHDIVIMIPGDPSGTTIITEQIEIDKEYTFLRGPGRDVVFRPTATTNATIEVSAEGVEIFGCRVETAATGDGTAINVSGDFCKVSSVFIEYAQESGIRLQNVSFARLNKIHVRNTGQGGTGVGILLNGATQNCKFNEISNALIINNASHGIHLTGVNCQNNHVWGGDNGTIIMSNGGWGVLEDSSANINHVLGPVIHIHENTTGEFSMSGVDSSVENITQWSTHSASDVWSENILGNDAYGTFGRALGFSVAAETTVTGGTATIIQTGLIEPDDFWNDHQVVIFDSSGGQKVIRNIDDYAQANGAITFNTALSFAPAVGDIVMVFASSSAASAVIDAGSIADAVWDEGLSGHVGAGSTGEALNNVSGGSSPSQIASAVWEEATDIHNTVNTFGWLVKNGLSDDGYAGLTPDTPTNTSVTLERGRNSNAMVSGVADGTVRFSTPTTRLIISVEKRAIKISVDKGVNYLNLPIGVNTLSIGQIKDLRFRGIGTWHLIASYI